MINPASTLLIPNFSQTDLLGFAIVIADAEIILFILSSTIFMPRF